MMLEFNNPWMKLYAASMEKVFRIEVITDSEIERLRRRNQRALVSVSALPGVQDMALLADPYAPVFYSLALPDLSTSTRPYSNLYIKSDERYFQVAHVCESLEQCNDFCLSRDDVAVICTDNAGRHYLASLNPLTATPVRADKQSSF